MHLTHVPLRLATGAFILNSGITKLGADDETAEGLHGMASTAYPALGKVRPKDFTRALAGGEIALGAVLLAPTVSPVVAGAALTGFGAGLLGLYVNVPGLRQEGSIRPTQQGTAIAKDVWLAAAGVTITAQGLIAGARRAGRKARKKVAHAGESAVDALPFTG
ncbi:hypothetical protein [Nocardioides donggukensis]|uniref:DoxX family membrane protein n=1 Tax=Nocardioides donggukensis TaxID=2774019 RepID=A0A927Q011_9ACTN|nr:hypothetical protein [Nocardioides donggukensis]MBD8870030.1 hypothetical protein [Nocardioides donggukensis]